MVSRTPSGNTVGSTLRCSVSTRAKFVGDVVVAAVSLSSLLFPVWLLLSPVSCSAATDAELSPTTLSLPGRRCRSTRRGLRGSSRSDSAAGGGAAARMSVDWRRQDRLATGGGRGVVAEWPLATLPPPPPLTAIATPFPWQRLPRRSPSAATQVLSSGTGVNWCPVQRHQHY